MARDFFFTFLVIMISATALAADPVNGGAANCDSLESLVGSTSSWSERTLGWARARSRTGMIPMPAACLESTAAQLTRDILQADEAEYRSRVEWLGRESQSAALSPNQRAALLEILVMTQQAWLLANIGALVTNGDQTNSYLTGGGLALSALLMIRYNPFSATVQARAIRKSSRIYLRASTYLAGRIGATGAQSSLETIGDQAARSRQNSGAAQATSAIAGLDRRPSPASIASIPGLSLPLDYNDWNYYVDVSSMAGNAGVGFATGLAAEVGISRAMNLRRAAAIRALIPNIAARTGPAILGIGIGIALGKLTGDSIENRLSANAEAHRRREVEAAIQRIQSAPPELRGRHAAEALQLAIHYFIENSADYRWAQTEATYDYAQNRICFSIDNRNPTTAPLPNWPQRTNENNPIASADGRIRQRFETAVTHRADRAGPERQRERANIVSWLTQIRTHAGEAWLPWYNYVQSDLLQLSDGWSNGQAIAGYADGIVAENLAEFRGLNLTSAADYRKAVEISRRWNCQSRSDTFPGARTSPNSRPGQAPATEEGPTQTPSGSSPSSTAG